MDWYNSGGMVLSSRRSEHLAGSSSSTPIEDPRRAFGSKLAEALLMEVAIASRCSRLGKGVE